MLNSNYDFYINYKLYCKILQYYFIIISGGFYCPNGTAAPIHCSYPYYCPEGSSFEEICPLGYKATAIPGNRTSPNDACLICPAGYYGTDVKRLNCSECPQGYFCPAGTKDPYEHACPKGYYCPRGSAAGVSVKIITFKAFKA